MYSLLLFFFFVLTKMTRQNKNAVDNQNSWFLNFNLNELKFFEFETTNNEFFNNATTDIIMIDNQIIDAQDFNFVSESEIITKDEGLFAKRKGLCRVRVPNAGTFKTSTSPKKNPPTNDPQDICPDAFFAQLVFCDGKKNRISQKFKQISEIRKEYKISLFNCIWVSIW